MVELPARLVFGLCALALMAGIIQLMRHSQIKEKYVLLWFPLGFAFTFFALFPEILVWVSSKVGLHYITVVVLCVILAFTLILLYFTARLSQLREDVKKLGQEMALLRTEKPAAQPAASSSEGWIASPAAEKPVHGKGTGEV